MARPGPPQAAGRRGHGVVGLLALLVGGSFRLAGPVQEWLVKAPKTLEQAGRRLRTVLRPMEQVSRAAESVQDATSPAAQGTQEVVILAAPA